MDPKAMSPADMRALYEKGVAAGMVAGIAAIPVPMVVRNESVLVNGEPLSGGPWYVSEGACGFAWVKIFPGNSRFANWLKKAGLASAAYGGGVEIWVSEFNQSVARKEAYAEAMAKVFKEAGIPNVYAGSRLD